MRGVRVDAARRTARAEGGATWGDFNHATHAFGLATTGGIISTTGIGGLTLGGGIGYLARGFGLSIDNLISADVVTADGRLVVASETENEDLFWALRGGGGNFGVVTSFEYRLHPVWTGLRRAHVLRARARPTTILRFYRDFIASAPEQLGAFPAFQIAPPLPFIPEDRVGDTFIIVVAALGRAAGRRREGPQALPRRGAGGGRVRRADALSGPQRARSTGWSRPACSTTGRPASASSTTAPSARTWSTGRRSRP